MIYESALISIVIQFITALVDVYGIQLPVKDNYSILKEILQVELGVQLIELVFYIWLVLSIHSIRNVTLYRYADWFITTPIMLITLMAYLDLNEEKVESFWSFVKSHKTNILWVVGLNALMLLFGFLAELMPGYQIPFVLAGCVPFVAYFYKIYQEYLRKPNPDVHPVFTRSRIFWYFAIVWSLYGVAALFPYVLKNTMLNVLDLFSKNAFGIMLVYILSHHSIGLHLE
jgi:bacteriorhodopsin